MILKQNNGCRRQTRSVALGMQFTCSKFIPFMSTLGKTVGHFHHSVLTHGLHWLPGLQVFGTATQLSQLGSH